MADFSDLDTLFQLDETSGLRRKVAIATMVAAEGIRQDPAPSNPDERQRKRFAQTIFKNKLGGGHFKRSQSDQALAENELFESIYRDFLMAHASDTVSVIQNLTDAQIQTAVDNAVDLMAKTFKDP